jgi:hypothetical protein
MRQMLRACALVLAIASAAQAGEIQYGKTAQLPATGTEILILLENLLFLF